MLRSVEWDVEKTRGTGKKMCEGPGSRWRSRQWRRRWRWGNMNRGAWQTRRDLRQALSLHFHRGVRTFMFVYTFTWRCEGVDSYGTSRKATSPLFHHLHHPRHFTPILRGADESILFARSDRMCVPADTINIQIKHLPPADHPCGYRTGVIVEDMRSDPILPCSISTRAQLLFCAWAQKSSILRKESEARFDRSTLKTAVYNKYRFLYYTTAGYNL